MIELGKTVIFGCPWVLFNHFRTESTGYRRQREVLKVEVDTLTKAKQHVRA